MDELISKKTVLDALAEISREVDDGDGFDYAKWREYFYELPPEHGTNLAKVGTDCISRQAAIDAIRDMQAFEDDNGQPYLYFYDLMAVFTDEEELPSAQPERDTPKRVLWTGWKGHRYTRYNCPNCKKPVRNDDVYCHRCGQRLMFPKVSHTPYVEGQKQEVIVRWDDE